MQLIFLDPRLRGDDETRKPFGMKAQDQNRTTITTTEPCQYGRPVITPPKSHTSMLMGFGALVLIVNCSW